MPSGLYGGHRSNCRRSLFSFAEEDGAPLKVSGHAQFLAQLVSNLVDNALKYGASGGAITMTVRRKVTTNSCATLSYTITLTGG